MDLFSYAPKTDPSHPFPLSRGIPIARDKVERVKATWTRPDFGFERMEIGDSFDVWPHQCGNEPLIVVQNTVSGAASQFRKKNPGRTFTTRQINGQFVRCWRTA